jgi:5-methylcytosine-specific restriction protein A
MPWKPLLPCRHPNCPNLSEQAYCPLHRKAGKAAANRAYDENGRDKEMRVFYTSPAWRELRALKLKRNPLCEQCYREGRIGPAVIADHILPARENPDGRLDMNNLQSMCRACHNRKHGGGQRSN